MVIIRDGLRYQDHQPLHLKQLVFHIAKIAAKLAVGYTLDEITNDITKKVHPHLLNQQLIILLQKF